MPSSRVPLRGLLAPLVLLVVAFHQMVRVHTAGWSTWRGGGFGMYAEFHPEHREAWLWLEDGRSIRVDLHENSPELDASALQKCLARANEGCLRRALERMPNADEVERIEVWRLSFDSDTATLGRVLLAEVATGSER